jgi:hypothetical protein
MFGLVSVSLPSKHVFIIFTLKKNGGKYAKFYFFSFDSFIDIVCIFA